MDNIYIRNFEETDLSALKSLILEAFGEGWNLGYFDQTEDFFQTLLAIYLSMFLDNSTFGKVAILKNKVVGAVLGSAKGEIPKFRLFQGEMVSHALHLLTANDTERMDVAEHLSKSFQTIGQLLENNPKTYDGSLEFLAVSKQLQGQSIGKMLWNEAVSIFKDNNINTIYLISDSACNTGFYDHHGFSLVDSKEVVYNYTSKQKKFNVLLYDYKF